MRTEAASVVARVLARRVIDIRDMREAKMPPWQRLHKAADRNRPALEQHVAAAFRKAAKVLSDTPKDEFSLELNLNSVMEALEDNLRDGLEDILLDTMTAGGNAAAKNLLRSPVLKTAQGYYKPTLRLLQREIRTRAAGDIAGHEFHGNQYTDADTIKDKSGKPLTVYHGSVSRDVDAESLDPTKDPVRPRPGQLTGVYFTSDPHAASGYTRVPGAGIKTPPGRVISAHLKMKNPLNITKSIKEGRKKGLSFGDAKRNALKAVTPGHDGVIFEGDSYNADEYLVFRKEQIVKAHRTLEESEQIQRVRDLLHALSGYMRTAGDLPGHEFHGNQYSSGGSSSGGKDPKTAHLEERGRNHVKSAMSGMGFDFPADKVKVEVYDKSFKVGDQAFQEAGHFSPATGEITLNANTVLKMNRQQVQTLVAHEVTHRDWKDVEDVMGMNYTSSNIDSDISAAAEKTESYAKVKNILFEHSDQLRSDDGVTSYSKAYWRQAGEWGEDDPEYEDYYFTAVNETLAEISATDHREGRISDTPTKIWRELHNNVKRTSEFVRTEKKKKKLK